MEICNKKNLHIIEILEIFRENNFVRINLSIDGNIESVCTYFSDNVTQYITIDRIDSVVMGLLFFAIKNGYDFHSEIPISAALKYKLENHLIPALLCNEGYHRVIINAPVIETYEKIGNIVATGISCGVDSLYTIATHSDTSSKYQVNHLTFFDVGSHRRGNDRERAERLFLGRLDLAKRFCQEYAYPLIIVRSDIHELINKYEVREYSHLENDTYMMLFCILMIQKGVSTYLCSSSNTYDNFTCKKNPLKKEFGCDNYELLILTMASINETEFISSGGSVKRVDKVKLLCDYPPAWKYLNVCIEQVKNDSTCSKCVRTLMAIDAFDSLYKFKEVFDINNYKTHRKAYLYQMYIEGKYHHWKIVQELFPYYKNEFTAKFKINLFIYRVKKSIKYRLERVLNK